jgi:hypothetical protein
MRKRIYNWQGQRFAYIWLEGEPGQSLEKQSQVLSTARARSSAAFIRTS